MTEPGAGLARLFLIPTLVASMLASPLCGVARADDHPAGKSIATCSTTLWPIGKLYSAGAAWINRRKCFGEQAIWSGDLIQVSEGAQVAIDSAGDVQLAPGTEARFAVTRSNLQNAMDGSILTVDLMSGAADVSLRKQTRGYAEAGGSRFIAAMGSSFRLQLRGGQVAIDVLSGRVDVDSKPRDRDYFVDMEKYNPAKAKWEPQPRTDRAKAGSTSQRRLRVTSKRVSTEDEEAVNSALGVRSVGYSASQIASQQGEEPAEGVDVAFKLSDPDAGTLVSRTQRGPEVIERTDLSGYATITFEAGRRSKSTTFTATVTPTDGKSKAWEGTIFVIEGFWSRWRNRTIIGAAVAAAITLIVRKGTKPLRQEPPPQIP